jgi:hypothetical protein
MNKGSKDYKKKKKKKKNSVSSHTSLCLQQPCLASSSFNLASSLFYLHRCTSSIFPYPSSSSLFKPLAEFYAHLQEIVKRLFHS